MAINDTSATVTSATQSQVNMTPVGNAQPRQQQSDRWSFHNASPFSRTPIGRNIGSEALAKLTKSLAEVYKNGNPQFEISLIPLDNNNEKALQFSALVVAVRDKTTPTLGVSYYTLILEGSGEKIPPKYENIGNKQVEVYRVTGEAYESELAAIVERKVREMFPNTQLIPSEAMVVPSHFNPEDAKAVHQLAVNAGIATHTELMIRNPDFKDLNLGAFANDSNLIAQLTFDKKVIENAAGLPVRSDFEVYFKSQQQSNSQIRSINNGSRVTKVSQVNGFIDLMWAPVVTNPYGVQQQFPGQQMPLMSQKYAARMVLTSLESDYLNTLPAHLLTLVTAMSVSDDNNWYNVFRSRPQMGNVVNMHDIGAVNIEANIYNEPSGVGSFIDTTLDTFAIKDLASLIAQTIRPGLMISMDVESCGAQSWYTSVFQSAASGNRSAVDAIYNAAQNLTAGHFGQKFPQTANIFANQGEMVHLGYYEDAQGVKRDLRDIDYLAVMNMSKDPETIKTWSDTFNQTSMSIVERLAIRKRLISNIVQRAEFTGYATRVTFTVEFITALTAACQASGLMMRIDTSMTGNSFVADRGVAGFAQNALLTFGGAGIFSGSQIPNAAGFNNSMSGFNRWG